MGAEETHLAHLETTVPAEAMPSAGSTPRASRRLCAREEMTTLSQARYPRGHTGRNRHSSVLSPTPPSPSHVAHERLRCAPPRSHEAALTVSSRVSTGHGKQSSAPGRQKHRGCTDPRPRRRKAAHRARWFHSEPKRPSESPHPPRDTTKLPRAQPPSKSRLSSRPRPAPTCCPRDGFECAGHRARTSR